MLGAIVVILWIILSVSFGLFIFWVTTKIDKIQDDMKKSGTGFYCHKLKDSKEKKND